MLSHLYISDNSKSNEVLRILYKVLTCWHSVNNNNTNQQGDAPTLIVTWATLGNAPWNMETLNHEIR